MVAVILNILKVIGIILLCLVGIVLLLILTVLFVPVRYEAKGYYRGDYTLRLKASWCLHLLSFVLFIDTEHPLTMEFKLFGIKFKKRAPKEEGQESEKTEMIQEEKMQKQEDTAQPQLTHTQDGKAQTNKSGVKDRKTKAEKLNFFQKIKLCIHTAFRNLIDLQKSILRFIRILKKGKDKLLFYIELLQGDEFHAAFARCKMQIFRILSNLKPKKMQMNLHFGRSDEPDLVGKILGIWGMTYPIHKGNIQVIPEFEQDILEGDFYVKGRISLYLYLWTVYIVLFDKNIKYLKACVTQED